MSQTRPATNAHFPGCTLLTLSTMAEVLWGRTPNGLLPATVMTRVSIGVASRRPHPSAALFPGRANAALEAEAVETAGPDGITLAVRAMVDFRHPTPSLCEANAAGIDALRHYTYFEGRAPNPRTSWAAKYILDSTGRGSNESFIETNGSCGLRVHQPPALPAAYSGGRRRACRLQLTVAPYGFQRMLRPSYLSGAVAPSAAAR
jgi:hypothetical protein